jgi:GNAT superfamily N-acetyltransferase
MKITDAAIGDIPLIGRLAEEIWPQAFRAILSPEQIAYMLRWMYSSASLEEQMKKGHRFLLLSGEEIFLGYASWSADPATGIARLHKLYVLPGAQGGGGGSLLLEEVIRRARRQAHRSLRLNVNRFNRAIAFYEKKGFRITGEEDNDIGSGYFMNDYVMELDL